LRYCVEELYQLRISNFGLRIEKKLIRNPKSAFQFSCCPANFITGHNAELKKEIHHSAFNIAKSNSTFPWQAILNYEY
jgi:hypothetical protein